MKKCGHTEFKPILKSFLQFRFKANFYHCTDEILAGLGEMYVSDDRFKKNIDKHAEGTAEFVSNAIKFYCNK